MNLFDVKKAEKILPKLYGIKVKLVNPTKEMKDFEKLKEFGAEVEIVDGENPAIIISKGDIEITYMAIPIQMEFEPFLKTLAMLAKDEVHENLKLNCEGEIKVFIAPVCPHCAQVVESINKIAIANPSIKVKIIDVMLYPELGEKYEITSAPTVVIKDVKLVGEYTIEELFEWVKKVLCGEDYKTDYYVILLKDGKIEEVKKDVEKNDKNLIALVNVLEKPEIMARVGAIMILEEIGEKNPNKLIKIKDRLIEMLKRGTSKEDLTVIQDVVYLIGKIGDTEDIKLLEKLKELGDEDIKDAVDEAIEEIMERK